LRNYILRRLAVMLVSLVGVSIIIFVSIRLVPGDVVSLMMGQQGDMAAGQAEQLRTLFGLDRPMYIQYLDWASNALRGDFGVSLRSGRPILPDIVLRAPITLELTVLSAVIALVFSIPLGIFAAVKRDSFPALFAQLGSLGGLSIPAFWLGTMVILFSSRYLHFYGGGAYISPSEDLVGNLRMFILPSLTVGFSLSGALVRYTRSAMLEILGEDYVRTARAKGLKEFRVVLHHALPNAMIPIITVLGLQLGFLLGGVVVIESVFALPGMGRLVVDAINQRDYPMVQGVILLLTSLVMLTSLVVDLMYAYVDPRVRYE
jgi:peptide/nickel transport system permease protein